MKVYSRPSESQYMIDFVTSREPSEFEMKVINLKTHEERPVFIRQVHGQANLFKLDEYDFFYKIKTNPLTYWGNEPKYRMFQVVVANQDTMQKADMLCLTEHLIVTGYSYKELEEKVEEKNA